MKKYLVLFLFVCVTTQYSQNAQLLELKSNVLINSSLHNKILLHHSTKDKKSGFMAVLYSLLLPGMGELYAGDYSTGKYFTIADGVLWTTFTGMIIYGNNKEDDYRAFAESYGSVNLDGKDEEYFANISIYNNIADYNRDKELNRKFNEVYSTETHYWTWLGTKQRKEYRELWLSSENAKNNVRFVVGGLILNRIISAIWAARTVAKYNKNLNTEMSWNINFDYDYNPYAISSLKMNFRHSL
ncbi:MAG: hypothetical protein CR986_06475 [Ignavibacteriae bacterium]|nr:MAG: hypothetical protein CR986_06475 [Ignavibacteriota bacterium]